MVRTAEEMQGGHGMASNRPITHHGVVMCARWLRTQGQLRTQDQAEMKHHKEPIFGPVKMRHHDQGQTFRLVKYRGLGTNGQP